MKRCLSFVLLAIFAFSLVAGCGGAAKTDDKATTPAAGSSAPAASKTPTIDKIKKEGKLVIGTSPDYPPFESLDKNNNVIGFDIDMMQAVADKLGVKLEIVQMGFDGLIAGLNAKKFDIMAAGVSVTDERKQSVDFSKPYIVGKDAVVVNTSVTKPITKLEDLKGMKVAVQIGTVQADALKQVQGVDVKEYNLFTECAQAVAAKQADALFLAEAVANAFIKADPKNLKLAASLSAKDTAYALRKDTPDLTEVVNQTIDELQKSGKFDELLAKWFK